MKTMFNAILGLSLVALAASPAFAQGRGGGMMGGGGYAMLIGNEGVQKELKLEDSQVEKAKEVAEKARERFGEFRSKLEGLEGEELQKKRTELMTEANKEDMKALGEFLKPEQLKRLKQISYHSRGPGVFSDSEVAAKLNLTDSQKTEIGAIAREMMEEGRKIREENQGEFETIAKKTGELRKECLEKAVAKLNDEQKKTYKELVGEPFTVTFQRRPQ
jgi:Spy/CpxP family protein refolding chaperone